MNKNLDKKNNLQEGEMIKLCYDEAFKIIYANQDHPEILAMLLSKVLKIDYKLLEGNITLLPLSATNKTIGEKKCERDILVSVKTNHNYNIIIEVNVRKDRYQSIIDRNLYYAYQTAGHSLQESMNYDDIPDTILINFNTFFVNKNQKNVIEEFCYRDKYGYVLTEKNINYNINIEECYNLWYNNKYQGKFEPYEEDLVLLCAAMMVDKEEDFRSILRLVQMKPEIMELMEGLVREMNHNEKLVTEYKTWKNEEERINASIISEVRRNSIKEGMAQKEKELVLNMFNQKLSVSLISECVGLTEDKVKEIIDNKE